MSGVLAGSVGVKGQQVYRELVGGVGGVGGIRAVGVSGVHWGGRWTGSLTTLDPSPGFQYSHQFPLGSDLPHQGQARAPVQGPITTTGLPWGVTFLTNAKQVTEMSSAGYYVHLALYLVTVCTFVSMPHNHIFLHVMLRNVIWTMFSPDQFTDILTPSI